jgi:hypothetical protein
MNEITTLSNVFQHHLSWDKRRCDFAASYIIAVFKVCTVNGIKIANALDGKSKKESKYRRVQRFFAEFSFRGEDIARMILALMPIPPPYTLSLDRTEWHFGKVIFNILVLGIVVEGTSMTLFWMMLPKAGNSRTGARQKLLKRLLLVMPVEHIGGLVVDHEFISQHWFMFLERCRIPFYIRLRANTVVDTPQGKRQIEHALPVLRLRSARTLLSVRCCVCNFHPFSVYLQRSCEKVNNTKTAMKQWKEYDKI